MVEGKKRGQERRIEGERFGLAVHPLDLVSSGAQGVDYVICSHHRLDPSARAVRGGAKSSQIVVAYKPFKRVTSDTHRNHVVFIPSRSHFIRRDAYTHGI